MGLFGSIGKVFGGALKIAGKVAGVASQVAPIPGLGFAGKIAQAAGKVVAGGERARAVVGGITRTMPGGVSVNTLPPAPWISTMNVIADAKQRLSGNVALTPRVAAGRTSAPMVAAAAQPMAAAPAPPRRRKRRKKATTRRRRRATTRRRSSRKRGRRLTRAQLRAGFGGKRRMRR